ncbi:MAG: hypothetical protein ACRDPJ_16180 [Nocardioidaceae bacterium]
MSLARAPTESRIRTVKSIQNRIHIDLNASGGRDVSLDTRRERVEAEAARLVSLGATRLHTNVEEGLDH